MCKIWKPQKNKTFYKSFRNQSRKKGTRIRIKILVQFTDGSLFSKRK